MSKLRFIIKTLHPDADLAGSNVFGTIFSMVLLLTMIAVFYIF
jgi:hypothetical protein